MSAPIMLPRREFIARLSNAQWAVAHGEAAPFTLSYDPCVGGALATMRGSDGEIYQTLIDVELPAAQIVVDQAHAIGVLARCTDSMVDGLRRSRQADEPLTTGELSSIHYWGAVRGETEPLPDELAERLTGDIPSLVESPDGALQLAWEGVSRITPTTPDTLAAADAAQRLVEIGGEDAVGLAAGVLYAAFEAAVESPGSRYYASLIREPQNPPAA